MVFHYKNIFHNKNLIFEILLKLLLGKLRTNISKDENLPTCSISAEELAIKTVLSSQYSMRKNLKLSLNLDFLKKALYPNTYYLVYCQKSTGQKFIVIKVYNDM